MVDLIINDDGTVAGSVYKDNVVRPGCVLNFSTLDGLSSFNAWFFKAARSLPLPRCGRRKHCAVAILVYHFLLH